MKLTVVIPVFNERGTIEAILERVKRSSFEKEILVVDDGSTDGTREYLEGLEDPEIRLIRHHRNQGKGAAVRTGIAASTGDLLVIQDADLEYSPDDYPELLKPIVDGNADVVYGSRFLGIHRVFMFWHYAANKTLTFLTNILFNTMLTDMETCYKAFRGEVIRELPLRSNGFDIEPEITAKIFKRNYRVYEIPITYHGRTYEEGKKITWRDAIFALWALLKFRFQD